MSSFINPYHSDTLHQQLSKLSHETKPQWGTMDAQQMIEHLILLIEVSMNQHQVTQATPEEKIEKLQQFLFSELPMPRNYKAPFVPENGYNHKFGDLDQAKAMLIQRLQESEDFFIKNTGLKTLHPVFGFLNHDGWKKVQEKHFTHHFTQFELI